MALVEKLYCLVSFAKFFFFLKKEKKRPSEFPHILNRILSTFAESILGMEDSSSTGSTFGTKSRNFHFFSGAKREEDSRPNFATGILKVLPSFAPSQVPNELSDKDLAEPRNTSTPVEFNRYKFEFFALKSRMATI